MVSGNETLITLDGIRVEYLSTGSEEQAVVALDDVSASLKRGEFVHLTGPNGSGKSTLLRLFAGLVTLQSGQLLWSSGKGDPEDIPKTFNVAMVYQDLDEAIVPMMGIGDHLAFRIYRSSREHLSFSKARERSRTYLKSHSFLEPLLSRFEDEAAGLSGGWKQLLQIAASLCCKPELLLLDEPTSHLAGDFANYADELIARETGDTAVVYISHIAPAQIIKDKITTHWKVTHGKLNITK